MPLLSLNWPNPQALADGFPAVVVFFEGVGYNSNVRFVYPSNSISLNLFCNACIFVISSSNGSASP